VNASGEEILSMLAKTKRPPRVIRAENETRSNRKFLFMKLSLDRQLGGTPLLPAAIKIFHFRISHTAKQCGQLHTGIALASIAVCDENAVLPDC